jgi:predicted porin
MKKTLVALAAFAAIGAQAQSTVSITGNFDTGINATDYKGHKVTTSGANNGSSTTALFITGVEDIGNGVKTSFQLEIDPLLADTSNRTKGTSATGTTSNTPSSLGNGQSFIGLESTSLGKIRFGTPNTETLAANGDANQGLATAIGSGYRVTSFDAVRFQNSLRYDTPQFAGFSGAYLHSAKNTGQANKLNNGQNGNLNNQTNGRDQAVEISAAYANGPLTVRVAQLTVSQWADVSQQGTGLNQFGVTTWADGTGKQFKLNTLSAKYNFNDKLSASLFRQTIASDALVVSNAAGDGASTTVYDRTTNGVAASYQATPVLKLIANYQKAKNGSAANSAGTAKAGLNSTVQGLGVDYALSKRTVLYVRAERDIDPMGARDITGYTATNNNYTATAAGIRHAF